MTRRQALAWVASTMAIPLGCKGAPDIRPTLRLATWGGAGDDSDFYRLVQEVYREFERQSGCRLRVEGTPGSQDYVSKLLLDFVAGSMPDIITLDASSSAAFIENGALLDLSPFIELDRFNLDAFYPNVLDIARRGHKLFALPIDFTPMVIYCNRRLFREAKVDVPSGRWSFDDFLTASKRMTQNGIYGFEFSNIMPFWIMFLWNNGGDVLSPDGTQATGWFDSEKCVEAVQFLADMVLKHKASPDLSQAAAAGVDYFATGRAAMKAVGHWNIVGLRASKDIDMSDVSVVEMPTQLPQSVTVMYEAGNAIGANCKNPKLAWEYLKYFSSHKVQSRYNASGIAVCARQDVEAAKLNLQLANKERDLDAAFQRIVPMARPPWGSKVEGYDRVEDIGQRALDAVLKNHVPVKSALSEAAHAIDLEFSRR